MVSLSPTPAMTSDSTLPAPDHLARRPKSFTRFLPATGRVLLGLPMVVFGLNAFLNFIPPPPNGIAPGAQAFSVALVNTGYMMPLIGLTQLLTGLMLISNRFVPLALVLLAPFFVNSILFHTFLEHTGLPMALIFVALELALAWHYRRAYAPLFHARS